MTAEELRGDWEDIALLEDAVAVEARNGGLVAYADVLNRSYVSVSVYGYVHPGHRGRGLGAFLVGWGEGWARERLDLAPEGARVVVQFYVYPRSEARFPVFSDPGASGTIIGGGMLARGVRERSKHGVRVARGGGVSPLPLGS
jgi:GNAT superfamily N-acetyltransferase